MAAVLNGAHKRGFYSVHISSDAQTIKDFFLTTGGKNISADISCPAEARALASLCGKKKKAHLKVVPCSPFPSWRLLEEAVMYKFLLDSAAEEKFSGDSKHLSVGE